MTKNPDPELDAARVCLERLTAKTRLLIAQPGDAALARKNLRGVSVIALSPRLNRTASDTHITGAVGGRKARQQRMASWEVPGTGKRSDETTRSFTRFNFPVARSIRPRNSSGATSLHLSFSSISRTRPSAADKGTSKTAGAAGKHVAYIEREGAVAVRDDAASKGAEGDAYIARGEAVALGVAREPVLFTNISNDPSERREYWDLVEAHEAKPSPDKIELTIAAAAPFWKAIADDDDCPRFLSAAIRSAGPEKFEVTTTDNKPVRKLLMRHGWSKEDAKGARPIDGRGGRVQNRIVGELPAEIDHDARVRIVRDFSRFFEERRLPFLAVMHAPDHHNDERNWHFHLVFHDRPARRFTGRTEDHLPALTAGAKEGERLKHQIAEDALSKPAVLAQIGRWDFTVTHKRRKPSGDWKITRPFVQPKVRSCNAKDFLPRLRSMLAELTNRELAAAEVERRVDPRSFKKMAIDKEPDRHLGTKAAALEKAGVPTAAGIQNEANQWRYLRQCAEEKRQARETEIANLERRWKRDLEKSRATEDAKERALQEIDRWSSAERGALEHRAIAEELAAHMDRLRSRAEKEFA